jgi:hypothetical protein
LAGQGIIGLMGIKYASGVYIVAATKVYRTDYWAVATRREKAVAAVQQLLEPVWTVTLTERRITPKQLERLKLRPNGVRKLGYMP